MPKRLSEKERFGNNGEVTIATHCVRVTQGAQETHCVRVIQGSQETHAVRFSIHGDAGRV